MIPPSSHHFCVAPMMEWTDRHCRYFMRLLSRHARLYTEMVTTGALLHGDVEYLLRFHSSEHPLALQLGGSEPAALAAAARLGADFGYDEINLNVGCPSDRVQTGRFGACLMAEPRLVAECVAAMRAAVALPVTVKTRIGIDALDRYEDFFHFITTVAEAGCDTFIVHARKAWLQGLSPKQNREVPPLRYEFVQRLKRELPHLKVILNGGLTTLAEARQQLADVDGVMLGRAAYHNPALLLDVDRLFYGDTRTAPTPHAVVEQLLPYVEEQLRAGAQLHHITRHVLGLFQAQRGARAWRRHLSEHGHRAGAGPEVLRAALARVA